MKRLMIGIALCGLAGAVLADEHAPSGAKRYTDSDWNVSFVRACGPKKSAPYLKFDDEAGDRYARFTLNSNDTAGQCKSDRKKKRARAEIRSVERMTQGNSYQFSTRVRFPEGVPGDVIFMQVHANKQSCKHRPPVKLRIMNGMRTLRLEALGRSTSVDVAGEFGDTWTTVDVVLNNLGKSGTLDIVVNGKPVIQDWATVMEKSCAKPWGKIGLFSLNDSNRLRDNDTVVADYDDVTLTRLD
jgi:hypothetical protein